MTGTISTLALRPKEPFGDIRDLRGLLHIHDEKARPFSAFRKEVPGFWLQFFCKRLENFDDLALADGPLRFGISARIGRSVAFELSRGPKLRRGQ